MTRKHIKDDQPTCTLLLVMMSLNLSFRLSNAIFRWMCGSGAQGSCAHGGVIWWYSIKYLIHDHPGEKSTRHLASRSPALLSKVQRPVRYQQSLSNTLFGASACSHVADCHKQSQWLPVKKKSKRPIESSSSTALAFATSSREKNMSTDRSRMGLPSSPDRCKSLSRVLWGSVWSRPGLECKHRSLLNVAMLCVMNRPSELAVHVRGAVNNGASEIEIRETLLQASIYAGMPAGLEGFRVAEQVLKSIKEQKSPAV